MKTLINPLVALAPAAKPVKVSAERYGRFAKTYVKTSRDRAISPELQAAMLERNAVADTVTIDAGHSPFFSQPDALVRALLAVQ